jgi:hypothetical protein
VTISVSDVLGTGRAASELVKAVERGIGGIASAATVLATPWQHRRLAKSEQAAARGWLSVLRDAGLKTTTADLALQERAVIRLIADASRFQRNREAVAEEAIAEFQTLPENTEPPGLQSEWIDRFWRLAQEVSEPDVQALWGRILSRQSTGGGKFSAVTLDLLSSFSRDDAKALEAIAPFTCRTKFQDGRQTAVVLTNIGLPKSTPGKKARQAELQALNARLAAILPPRPYDTFGSIGVFMESTFGYPFGLEAVDYAPLWVGSDAFIVQRTANSTMPGAETTIGSGAGFSPAGIEILSLIKVNGDSRYVEIIKEHLAIGNMRMIPAPGF